MKVQQWEIGRVKPYEKNPRINDKAVSAVAASLREFGFRQPIVVDAECVIIVGHTRWKAAQELGLKKVSVHVATDLSAEQVRAYRIADNATGDLAEWDFDLLLAEIQNLQGEGLDLGVLGFSEHSNARNSCGFSTLPPSAKSHGREVYVSNRIAQASASAMARPSTLSGIPPGWRANGTA